MSTLFMKKRGEHPLKISSSGLVEKVASPNKSRKKRFSWRICGLKCWKFKIVVFFEKFAGEWDWVFALMRIKATMVGRYCANRVAVYFKARDWQFFWAALEQSNQEQQLCGSWIVFGRIISETPMGFEGDLRFTTGSCATRGFEI